MSLECHKDVLEDLIQEKKNERCFEGRNSFIQKFKRNCLHTSHFWCKEDLVRDIVSLLNIIGSL